MATRLYPVELHVGTAVPSGARPSLGRDMTLLKVPADTALTVSMDTLVADIHFFRDSQPQDIGYKALAANLSDLAAMGAHPQAALLSLTNAGCDQAWLASFTGAVAKLADRFGVALLAEEITEGPLSITIQVYGYVSAADALRRDTAREGDLVFVTGTLGDAGLALAVARGRPTRTLSDRDYLLARLARPEPRVAAGMALRGVASAAIDISDGLLADLGHVLESSRVGASIDVTRLPLSEAVERNLDKVCARDLALSAGDDYELCFTVPQERLDALRKVEPTLRCLITRIGKIETKPGIRCFDEAGALSPHHHGYRHFE